MCRKNNDLEETTLYLPNWREMNKIIIFLAVLFFTENVYTIKIQFKDSNNSPVENVIIMSNNEFAAISDSLGSAEVNNAGKYDFVRNGYVPFSQDIDKDTVLIMIEKPHQNDMIIVEGKREKLSLISNISEIAENDDFVKISNIKDISGEISGLYSAESNDGSVFQIWGMDASRISILLNGVKINDNLRNNADLSFIPVEDIKRVEVYKGSQINTAGENSIGGIVNIITEKKGENTNFSLLFEGGSFDKRKINFSFNQPFLNMNINYETQKGDFEFYNFSQDRYQKRINNHLESISFSGSAGKEIKKNWISKLFLLLNRSVKGLPGTYNYGDFFKEAETEAKRFILSFENHLELTASSELLLKTVFKKSGSKYTDMLHIYSNSDNIEKENKYYIGLKKKIFNNVKLDLNVQSLASEIENNTIASEERKYILYNLNAELNLLLAGIKTNTVFGISKYDSDDYNHYSHQINSRFLFNDFIVSLKGGTGVKLPAIADLFWLGDGQAQGNPDLIPEEAENYSIKAEYESFPKLKLSSEVFYTKLKNYIFWHQSAFGVWQPDNKESDIVMKGFSLSADLKFLKNHRISFIYDHLSAKIVDNGYNLAYRPENRLNLDYLFRNNIWFSGFSFSFIDDRYPVDDREVILEGSLAGLKRVWITDFKAGFKFRWGDIDNTVTFRIDNLFDSKYEQFEKVPIPGRTFSLMFSLNYSLQEEMH